MRVHPSEFERLDLRIHSLLPDVPLHDVWAVDLPDGGAGLTLAELRIILSFEQLGATSRAVRLLFSLRRVLGRAFGWDRERTQPAAASFLDRLTASDRQASLVPPGTTEGLFRVLYVFPRETASEIRNATVHAVSSFALLEHSHGYRLYWAIYVRPVGPLTVWYMRLIDPFRRLLIYPAALRFIRDAWVRAVAEAAEDRPRPQARGPSSTSR